MNLALKFPLPKPAAPVAARELTVTVNGTARIYTLPGSALVSDEILFEDGDSYSVSLVDVDSHGNRSLPSKPLHGSIDDDARPATPDPLPPLDPAGKRFLIDAEAAQFRAAIVTKTAAEAKAAETKSTTEAKAKTAPMPAK